jgi:seryl-tRNA synthetase
LAAPPKASVPQWDETSAAGHASLTGNALRLYQQLDQMFLRWAGAYGAQEYQFPGVIAAGHLQQIEYFRNFPHLATFPVALDPNPDNLDQLQNGISAGELGELQPTQLVLTPAACYHFYPALQGQSLPGPLFVTTRGHCYRCEDHYQPLQRQWQFSMRELVCLGTAEEVTAFINEQNGNLKRWLKELGLPVKFEIATDPFYQPQTQPKALAQRLDPVKTEIVYGGTLAIG